VISQREVQRFAYERQVPEQMIELDYVLTWLLGALGSPKQSPRLIAKGGTTLKKVYFHSPGLKPSPFRRMALARILV